MHHNHWNLFPDMTPGEQAIADANRNNIEVWLDDRNWDDPEYPGIARSRSGYLTTNHPQSSYGIPVLILHESNLGPGGVRATGDLSVGARVYVRNDDMDAPIVQRAIAAGYPISDSPTVDHA